MSANSRQPPIPAVLRLVQGAVLARWRVSEEDIYREALGLLQESEARDVAVTGCGTGSMSIWLAERGELTVTGVDPDPEAIRAAEVRARASDAAPRLSFEQGALDDLPHETAVFDAAVGEPALSGAADPQRAVAELARVVKPMGTVLLLQPTWSSELSGEERELVVERLGMRPHLLVEWKQMLRDAGVVELQVQDWTCGPPRSTSEERAPLNFRDKVQIVGQAWRERGWQAARGAVRQEEDLLRALSRERALGFQLMKGVKWPNPI